MTNYNIPAKEHRANARKMLGGNIFSTNWMMSLLILLIYSVILSVASAIPMATIVIAGPLLVGVSAFFLLISRSNTAKIETLFDGFKNDFLQTFLIGLMTAVFTFLWSLLFIIPGIVKGYAYSMASYIKCDNPTYDWKKCLDESQRIMNGKKWNLFCLDLSFIGWMIVGSLACGIGTLWVAPYIQAAHTSFYESIAEKTISENSNDFTQTI